MHPKIEDAILDWVNEMYDRGAFIPAEIVKEKGKKVLEEINAKLFEEKTIPHKN